MRFHCAILATVLLALTSLPAPSVAADKPNIVFVLVDDLRYDAMSCAGHPFLKTPHLDALAEAGVRFRNAFVTTSLCSPSRATFLTGLYAHHHKVLDNATLMNPNLPTFPKLLQQAGYKTAFFGKWHMGGSTDKPRPGFDHWASFRGQGSYVKNRFNIDGEHKVIEGYISDVLTDMAADWLRANHDGPFMVYLSHKAVHGWFKPAPRHEDLYTDQTIELPPSSLDTPENRYRKPAWVLEQRQSWHGVDDAYFKRKSLDTVMHDYYRAIHAVDESVGRLVDVLREIGVYENTLFLFTSDNGFLWGEHGLIDKRCMYEESIRIPMIMTYPARFQGGRTLDPLVLNIDVAPTFLEVAGVDVPPTVQGQSFLTLPENPDQPWRTSFLYEYFWEKAFPETPTMFGVRTDRYKYIQYHGVWATHELYDLEKDPHEIHNHISTSRRKKVTVDPEYRDIYKKLRQELGRLKAHNGLRERPNWEVAPIIPDSN
jgi:N-acetylglucosamine-6-sulfatase